MEVGLNVFYKNDIVRSLWGTRVECGDLNAIDPHKLIESGIIRRYGLVAESVSLWGQALNFSILRMPHDI